MDSDKHKLPAENISYSLRRFFVDEFNFRYVSQLPKGSIVLDLGGNKLNKRGFFNIEEYGFNVVYGNYSVEKSPDVQLDATFLPFRNSVYDAVLCIELLEHVYQPEKVVEEIARVLTPGGRLFLTVPFMVPFHGDPSDYGRFTEHYLKRLLDEKGFCCIEISKQGYFWSVLLDMFRGYLNYARLNDQRAWARIWFSLMKKFVVIGRRRLEKLEPHRVDSHYVNNFTTGFGVVATKAGNLAHK